MKTTWSVVAVLVLAAIALTFGGSAQAGDTSLAETLFQEGKKLLVKKNYAEACPKLAESYKLDPGGGTLLTLALCHEQDGKLASAWAEFKDAEALAKRDNRNDREKIAKEHLAKIEPKLQTLTVTIADGGKPAEGFELKRNGSVIGSAAFGTAFPIDPGEHVFTASSPGKKTWTKTVSIHAGEKQTKIEIPKLEDEPKGDPTASPTTPATTTTPAEPPTTAAPPDRKPSLVPAFALIGTGVAAFGAGAFFALSASSKKSDADDKCPDVKCTDPGAVEKSEDAVTSANIANVAFGVGIVATAVGVILLVTSSGSSSSAKKAARPGDLFIGSNGRAGGARVGVSW